MCWSPPSMGHGRPEWIRPAVGAWGPVRPFPEGLVVLGGPGVLLHVDVVVLAVLVEPVDAILQQVGAKPDIRKKYE